LINILNIPVVFDYLDHLEESASIYYPESFFGKVVKTGVRQITRYNLKRADSVITVTQELKDFLSEIGVKEAEVIPNGGKLQSFKAYPERRSKKST